MAIAKIKRVDIIAHKSLEQDVLSYLQQAGYVEIISKSDESDILGYGEEHLETKINTGLQNTSNIESAIDVLERYAPRKSLLKKLADESETISADSLRSIGQDDNLDSIIKEVLSLHNRIPEIDNTIHRLVNEKDNLAPWGKLGTRLDNLYPGMFVAIILGTVPVRNLDLFREDFSTLSPYASYEVIGKTPEDACLALIVLKERSEEIRDFLSKHSFEEVTLQDEDKTVEELMLSLDEETLKLKNEREELQKKLDSLSERLVDVKGFYDYHLNQLNKLAVKRYMGNTDKVFQLKGWILAGKAQELFRNLEKMGPIKVNIKNPVEADGQPPVLIENRKLFKPFELITELYGMPLYRGLDPTVYLAPFFFIFFGLCLSDAGYGILLSSAMLIVMRVLRLKGKVFSLFFIGGIATVIGGAMTGTWFGVNVLELSEGNWASFLKAFVLFDPLGSTPEPFFGLRLEGTMAFFYLSLALGYTQICFGTLLSALWQIREKRFISGFLDDGAWLLAYTGLALYVFSSTSIIGLPFYGWASLKVPGIAMIITGLCFRLFLFPPLCVLFEKEKKSIISVLSLIGISLIVILDTIKNLLGNVLSYCRLMALGMATGVIGGVINELALKLYDFLPIVGVILMVLVLLGGHAFNLLVNLLGSFVHTARLQYVEFFPYFFRGGGERFKPFMLRYKYVNVDE